MTALLSRLTKPSVTNEPPTEGDLWRTEIAVVVLLAFALFLGIGIEGPGGMDPGTHLFIHGPKPRPRIHGEIADEFEHGQRHEGDI